MNNPWRVSHWTIFQDPSERWSKGCFIEGKRKYSGRTFHDGGIGWGRDILLELYKVIVTLEVPKYKNWTVGKIGTNRTDIAYGSATDQEGMLEWSWWHLDLFDFGCLKFMQFLYKIVHPTVSSCYVYKISLSANMKVYLGMSIYFLVSPEIYWAKLPSATVPPREPPPCCPF